MKTKKFPVGTGGGRRPDRAARKREEAENRQHAAALVGPAIRLKDLDARFGVGVGAKRERKRLNARMKETWKAPT